jgi:hypothetical protein
MTERHAWDTDGTPTATAATEERSKALRRSWI